jgi:hypothetical protein
MSAAAAVKFIQSCNAAAIRAIVYQNSILPYDYSTLPTIHTYGGKGTNILKTLITQHTSYFTLTTYQKLLVVLFISKNCP